MNTQEKLERLATIQGYVSSYELTKSDKKSTLDAEMQKVIDSVLTPEILAKVEEIKAEYKPKFDLLENDAEYIARKKEGDALTEEIKADVISLGETVKGSALMAVYAKGRTTWDNKGLDGFATAHPEIEKFRKVGEPSVSIRKI